MDPLAYSDVQFHSQRFERLARLTPGHWGLLGLGLDFGDTPLFF